MKKKKEKNFIQKYGWWFIGGFLLAMIAETLHKPEIYAIAFFALLIYIIFVWIRFLYRVGKKLTKWSEE